MILNSVFSGIMARIQNNRAQEEQRKALEVLDSEEKALDELFRSSYYSDYLQRADSQNIINSAKNMFMNNSNNLRSRASITGATDEWVATNQNLNNQALSSIYSNLAAQGANWKDNVMNNYLNGKTNISNKRYASFLGNSNNYQNSSLNHLSNIGQELSGWDNRLSNLLMSGISKKLKF